MPETIRTLPRYTRYTLSDGWEGADHQDGPWRSIPEPEPKPEWIPGPANKLSQAGTEVSGVQVLSPAAQAVLDAFWNGLDCGDDWGNANLAASLRAAADQIEHHWDGAECVDHLQALAAELAGDPDPITTEPHG